MAALLGAGGCGNHDPASRDDSIVAAGEADYAASHRTIAPPDSTPSVKAAPVVLDDAGIATLAGESNRRDIELARVAVGKATSGAVKFWARTLIDDHGRNDLDLRVLEKKLKLVEKPSSPTIKADVDKLKARFVALPRGLAFDTAFANRVADDHEAEIKQTKDLAAKAHDAELKKLLTESIVDLERHRDRGRALARLLIAKKTP